MKKILVILTLLMFVLSCGKAGGNGKTATFNMEAEPSSLDPQLLTDMGGFMITGLTYEGLVRLNEKNEVVPAGAESWEKSKDGTVWTFKLRKGMKWSNGDALTAKDYVNGMKRGLEPATASEYAFLMFYIKGAEDYNGGKIKDFNQVGIKAKDDYTIEFTLSKPAPFFDKTLVMPVYYPINAKALDQFKDKYATEANKSIYSGPYTIEKWTQDNKVILKKNPNYWNAANTKFDTLKALMVSDFNAATNYFENKELDLTKISLEKKASYVGKPELKEVPDGRVYYLAFNTKAPGLKNKKIRQALSLAIDRKNLVSNVLNGSGIVASGVVSEGTKGENDDFRKEVGDLYAQYKNVNVKALFDEGLKEEGLTPDKLNLTLTVDEKGSGKKEGEFYQSQWKEKLGLDVNVETITYKERLSRAKSGDFQIVRYAWGPDYADPMTYLEIFQTSAGQINVAKFSDPEYDKLVEFAKKEQDNKARMDAMKKAEKILMDDFRYTGLYYEVATYLQNPHLKGVVIRAVGNPIDFYAAYKD